MYIKTVINYCCLLVLNSFNSCFVVCLGASLLAKDFSQLNLCSKFCESFMLNALLTVCLYVYIFRQIWIYPFWPFSYYILSKLSSIASNIAVLSVNTHSFWFHEFSYVCVCAYMAQSKMRTENNITNYL